MIILIPSISKLDAKAKKALQNGEFTTDEVRNIQKEVDAHFKVKQKGFKRALIIIAGVFVLMAALSIPQLKNSVALFSLLAMGVVLAVIMLIVKWLYVDTVKRQFARAVKKGYPDFPFEQS